MPPSVQRFFFAMAPAGRGPIGSVWRFTGKKSDFYIDLADGAEAMHLSVHGPRASHPQHRFHLRVDQESAATAHERGEFAAHGIGPGGFSFEGQEIEPGVHHVLRVRWSADGLRRKYQPYMISGLLPEVSSGQPGYRMVRRLGTGECVDLDVFLSYGKGHVHGGGRAKKDEAVLGPIENAAEMFLSATCVRRLQRDHPTPSGLAVPKPTTGDEPNRILCGGTSDGGPSGIYWFVDDITTRSCLEGSIAAWVNDPRRTA